MKGVSDDYVQLFINSLNFNLEGKKLARLLFKTEFCCKNFYIGFYGRNRYLIDDLLDYRESRIENLKITLDKFIYMCYNGNIRKAFEENFLQSINDEDVQMIEKAVEKGSTSFDAIYKEFYKNSNKSILKIML